MRNHENHTQEIHLWGRAGCPSAGRRGVRGHSITMEAHVRRTISIDRRIDRSGDHRTGALPRVRPAACAYCHLPREEWSTLARGAMPPLTGNHLFRLPLGELYSPNITPDAETGIGRRTDGELARVLRHNVRADGRAAFPLMVLRSDERCRPHRSHLFPAIAAACAACRTRSPVDHAWKGFDGLRNRA